jgi:hypothetical protein
MIFLEGSQALPARLSDEATIVTRRNVTIDGILDWGLDLTTLSHDS